MNLLTASCVLTCIAFGTAAAQQPYIITRLAGSPGLYHSTDGTGSLAGFGYTGSLTLDVAGNLYVADSGAIRRVSSSGDVTTIAGLAGSYGYANGQGANARFSNHVAGLAADSAGTIYVAEWGTHAIRKVTASGEVTHFAGAVGSGGFKDGPAEAARFYNVMGLAVDRSGFVYAADSGNRMIRRVSPSGVVTTFVGPIPGNPNATYFFEPRRVSVDLAGNVYVTDFVSPYGTYLIKVDSTGGSVTNLQASPSVSGPVGYYDPYGDFYRYGGEWDVRVDAKGNRYGWDYLTGEVFRIAESGRGPSLFTSPWMENWVVDDRGSIYAFSNGMITKAHVDVPVPSIVAQPASLTLASGASAALVVEVSGGTEVTYQWKRNGVAIPGAQASTLLLQPALEGSYACVVTYAGGTVESAVARLSVVLADNPGHLSNLSVRSQVGPATQPLVVGLTLAGGAHGNGLPVLVRAVGPTLGGFGLTGFLPDPKLELLTGGAAVAQNDNWGGDPALVAAGGRVGAFALGGTDSKDAALYRPSLSSGAHSLLLTDSRGASGVVLAEVYDASPAGLPPGTIPRFKNLSARAYVGRGSDVLIAGLVVGGQTAQTLVIRAIGPSLGIMGVSDVLLDPRLELFAGNQLIRRNDHWGDTGSPAPLELAFTRAGAFSLPIGSRDAALVTTLPPGSYTVQISGVGSMTGTALLEVYEVP